MHIRASFKLAKRRSKTIPLFLSGGKGSEANPPKLNSAEILRQVSNTRHLGSTAKLYTPLHRR